MYTQYPKYARSLFYNLQAKLNSDVFSASYDRLLLELHALTEATRSYALLKIFMRPCVSSVPSIEILLYDGDLMLTKHLAIFRLH